MKDATVRRLLTLDQPTVLVVASAPSACAVCRGAEAWIPCPHCCGGIPIAYLPMREDRPRGAA